MNTRKNMKTFKLLLKSLINNASCVEGGRKKPWYFAIIMFVLAMAIAVLPITIQTLNKNGHDFINGQTSYGYEIGSLEFINDVNDKNIEMAIKKDDTGNYLSIDINKWNEAYGASVDENNAHSYPRYIHLDGNGNCDFEVYYFDVERITDELFKNVMNTVPTLVEEGTNKAVKWGQRSCSFIMFTRRQVISYVYAAPRPAAKGNVTGDYNSLEANTYRLNEIGIVHFDDNKEVQYNKHTVPQEAYGAYRAQVLANWKNFFNKAYQNNKMTALWQTSLIMLGIDTALVLFMGLMIFILTRGKNNPFRIYTFWETQKIAYWCTISPAILAMVLSFVVPGFAQIMFALLIGVRVMWLSMKTLRPENAVVTTSNNKNVQTVKSKPAKK